MYTIEDIMTTEWGIGYHEWWDKESPGEICLNMNDVFYWGCGDAEDFTESDLIDINKAIEECKDDISLGGLLWTCRKRSERPQGAYFTHIPKSLWHLFEAAGPYREPGLGNPCEIGKYHPENIKD